MVWGKSYTYKYISVSNGNLICYRMVIPAAPNKGDKVICWYTGFTLQSNKGFLLTSTFVPKGLSAPALGLYAYIKALKYIPGPGVR